MLTCQWIGFCGYCNYIVDMYFYDQCTVLCLYYHYVTYSRGFYFTAVLTRVDSHIADKHSDSEVMTRGVDLQEQALRTSYSGKSMRTISQEMRV